LEGTDSGVVCLVPSNVDEPWLNFEAGALSKSIQKARVHPFLLALDPGKLSGPLGQFQATRFSKDDLKKLVRAINSEAGGGTLPVERVDQSFEVCWPDLEHRLTPLLTEAGVPAAGAERRSLPSKEPVPSLPTSESPLPSLFFGRFPQGSFSISDPNGEHGLELPNAEHLFLLVRVSSYKSLSSKVAKEAIQKSRLKPMGGELLGSVSERNVVGAFICLHENYMITHLTQLHNNSELFGLDFESISKARLVKNADVSFGILPTLRFERVFTSTLANYLDVANMLKLPLPLSVTAGVSGIQGFRLSVSPEIFGKPYIGKALHDTIADTFQVSSYDTPSTSILRPFFNHVWEEFGEDRPDVEQLDLHA
jgi:hypothetical protein